MVTTVVSTEGNQLLRWNSFSLKDKRAFVHVINSIVSTSISRCQAWYHLRLSSIYHTCFRKVIKRVCALENGATSFPYKTNGNAQKIRPSPPSLLSVIKEDLSCYVFETRQCDIQLSMLMIHQEACCLLPNFRGKSIVAKNSAVLRFTKSIGLSNHAATHTTQKHFQETEQEPKHFIEFMKAKKRSKWYHQHGPNPHSVLFSLQ